MINGKAPAMTKFTCTVSNLCRIIDLRIDEKDYTSARCLVSDMETLLKRIVTAMILHNHLDAFESEMIMAFIRRIVADKRTIIMKNERIRYLESKEDDAVFEQEEENWKEYITPSVDEDSHHNSHRWEPDDDEENL